MKNPAKGMHPDLFGGESRIYVPLDDLTDEEIIALPRAAFDDSEWEELDEDLQEAIYENSEVDKARADAIARFLKNQARRAVDPESFDEGYELEIFEQWLNDHVYQRDLLAQISGGEEDEIEEEWIEQGYSDEQVQDALKEAIEDQTNWETEITDSRTGDYSHDLYGSIYIERHDLENFRGFDNEVQYFESDVEAAMKILRDDGDDYNAHDIFEYSDVWDLLNPDGRRYASVSIDQIDTDLVFNASPNWELIRSAVEYSLSSEEPEGGEIVVPERGEERRLMELPDGFYVADLYPTDLPDEGKKQGICVGQAQYGYARAVATGKTKILSLRRPSGKPLFTFEVSLDEDGDPEEVEQIKGKGNRLPGWDRGGTGLGKVKEHEVKLATMVVQQLGIDPEDVDDLKPGYRAVEQKPNPSSSYRPRKTFSDPVSA